MALQSILDESIVAPPDSIVTKGIEVANFIASSSNEYDQAINRDLCIMAFGICFCICLAVVICFIVVYRSKKHSKEKDYNLEIEKEKLKRDDKIQELKKEKDILEYDRDKESFIKKKEKEIRETVEKEFHMLNDLASISVLIDKAKNMELVDHEVNLIFKRGDNSITIKTPARSNSKNSDSNKSQTKE